MRVALTGATGMIGRAVVDELRRRGDEVTALTRDPASAARRLGGEVEVVRWADPAGEDCPPEALAGRDVVINLLGEPLAQRWTSGAKRRIRESRVLGTRRLVAGLRAADPRPATLVSQSASGWYGARGAEPLTEEEPPGEDFLAGIVADWEAEARAAEELGVRVVRTRTGVVLAPGGGALRQMLPPFRLGVGGPVAGGRQYVPWIHIDDVAGALVFCAAHDAARGPLNVCAPEPVTNATLSRALGRALHRPAVLPVPALALRALYGEMATVVTTGARPVPDRLQVLGYEFRRPDLDGAIAAALTAAHRP